MWDIRPAWRDRIHASGIPLIELAGVWDALEAESVDPWWWSVTGPRGHWNPRAHVAMGRRLAAEIARGGYADESSR
jgi:hypothetical protein